MPIPVIYNNFNRHSTAPHTAATLSIICPSCKSAVSSFSVNFQLRRHQLPWWWGVSDGGASGDEFKLWDFIVFSRFSVSIRHWNAFSADDIIHFELMFGLSRFTDSDGEGGVSVVQFSLQGNGITQICMGGFIERLVKRIRGWIEIIVPLKMCLSITRRPPFNIAMWIILILSIPILLYCRI